MIVRILTEGQYRLPGAFLDALDDLDDRTVEAVAAGDEARFRQIYEQMVNLVRKQGEPVPVDQIVDSEVILPPADISLEEAKGLFFGAGLVKIKR